jgi:hypothetical protein
MILYIQLKGTKSQGGKNVHYSGMFQGRQFLR